MMLDKYSNWQNSVRELNMDAQRLDDARNECYEWMSNKIKSIFQRNGMTIPKIHFASDGSVIECKWSRNIDLFIPVDLIIGLHMGFSFDVEIASDGEWLRVLTFYPFREVNKV